MSFGKIPKILLFQLENNNECSYYMNIVTTFIVRIIQHLSCVFLSRFYLKCPSPHSSLNPAVMPIYAVGSIKNQPEEPLHYSQNQSKIFHSGLL